MLRNAVLSILLLSVLLLIGCSRVHQVKQAVHAGRQLQQTGKTTIKTDEGELQINTDKSAQQATITNTDKSGEKHSITVGKDIDTSELSLAIYPGATKKGGQVVTTDQGKQLNFSFTTTDSFEKVADFYKGKYPDANISDIKSQHHHNPHRAEVASQPTRYHITNIQAPLSPMGGAPFPRPCPP